MNASKMAGPLALWVKSIVAYADIFLKIEPLRNELFALEEESAQLATEKEHLDSEVVRLEELVDRLNKEYELLIEAK
jgi:predicted nuclease with TOPRIM domain